MSSGPLIAPEELRDAEHGGFAVIDATWHLGGARGRDTYDAGHLPDAHFFDIDAVAEGAGELPHMMPLPEAFGAAVAPMIGDGAKPVVVYDQSLVRSAARLWWTFRVMGIDEVRVLDGGGASWQAAGGHLVTHAPRPARGVPELAPRGDLVVGFDDMRELIEKEDVLILDARSAGRFAGVEPEPRPGLRSGAMPGACSLPFGDLYNASGRMKPPSELEALIGRFDPGRYRLVVATCGSGISACSILLALSRLDFDQLALYDGSWAEWASRGGPVVGADRP